MLFAIHGWQVKTVVGRGGGVFVGKKITRGWQGRTRQPDTFIVRKTNTHVKNTQVSTVTDQKA